MALPMIETGYKPEFALGALYQGINAANAEQSAQEEILKQYLANQREQRMMPLDIEAKQTANTGALFDNMVKELKGRQAEAMNNPALIQQFVDAASAKEKDAIRQDQLAEIAFPMRKQQAPIDAQTALRNAQVQNEVAGLTRSAVSGFDSNNNPMTEPQRVAVEQDRTRIMNLLGLTSEQAGKMAIEHIKGSYGIDERNIAANAAVQAAQQRGANNSTVITAKINTLNRRAIELDKSLQKYLGKQGEALYNKELLKIEGLSYDKYIKKVTEESAQVKAVLNQLQGIATEVGATQQNADVTADGEQITTIPSRTK